MAHEDETLPNADAGPVDCKVGRLEPERAEVECKHPRKVEQHFTYGHRMHCPDCGAREESWWD